MRIGMSTYILILNSFILSAAQPARPSYPPLSLVASASEVRQNPTDGLSQLGVASVDPSGVQAVNDAASGNAAGPASSSSGDDGGILTKVMDWIPKIGLEVSEIGKATADVTHAASAVAHSIAVVSDSTGHNGLAGIAQQSSGVLGNFSRVMRSLSKGKIHGQSYNLDEAAEVSPMHEAVTEITSKISAITNVVDSVADSANTISEKVVKAMESFESHDSRANHSFEVRHGEHISDVAGIITSKVQEAFERMNQPSDVKARSVREVSLHFGLLIVSVAFAGAFGYWLENKSNPTFVFAKGRPQAWLLAILCSAAAIWMHALFSNFISFDVSINSFGMNLVLTQSEGLPGKPGKISRSLMGLIKSASPTSALALACYAIVAPALAAVLMVMGEFWRLSRSKESVKTARKCILTMQYLSKWSSPIVFAYVFNLCMMRSMNSQFPFLMAPTQLGIGFNSFTLFSILVTAASLAVEVPKTAAAEFEQRLEPTVPWRFGGALLRFGKEGTVLLLVLLLVALFIASLLIGMSTPALGCTFNSSGLMQPMGPMPPFAMTVIESLQGVHERYEFTFAQLLSAPFQTWFDTADISCHLGFVMFVVCALLFTVLDVCMLLGAAWLLYSEANDEEEEQGNDGASSHSDEWATESTRVTINRLMSTVHIMKHAAMLDVSIMGVLVITLAADMYQNLGIEFQVMTAVPWLIVAEFLHYTLYYLVGGAVEFSLACDPTTVVISGPHCRKQLCIEDWRGSSSNSASGSRCAGRLPSSDRSQGRIPSGPGALGPGPVMTLGTEPCFPPPNRYQQSRSSRPSRLPCEPGDEPVSRSAFSTARTSTRWSRWSRDQDEDEPEAQPWSAHEASRAPTSTPTTTTSTAVEPNGPAAAQYPSASDGCNQPAQADHSSSAGPSALAG
eukprot:gnl/TRDRNA2_/TRDRNA2_81062_c0_seq1.p1 gnl/TRDRNA2_/TRDRNA2_81062_c0~~gnl/TRDRNA2_/TRDRNA2_81062_c0_seq1.p1  ORF type:complete len:904 (-),score=132.41 gnl/TRDRNA2_/TRDRNA2_81062_c0_seq1:156-2867(-)